VIRLRSGYAWHDHSARVRMMFGSTINSVFGPVLYSDLESRADIYVDSVSGDDANAGTMAAPVQTLGQASTLLAALGDLTVIALKCGSSWREALDTSDYAGIVITTYSDLSDGLPLVMGDNVVSGTWDDNTDRADAHSSVYSIDVSVDVPSGSGFQAGIWVDGVRMVRTYSYAACQALAGSYYLPDAGGDMDTGDLSIITLALHPPGSTNPNSDGKTVEATARFYAVNVGDDSTVRLIHARRAGQNDGPIGGGDRILFDRCLGEDGYRHCLLAASGEMTGCIGWMQTVDDSAGYIVQEFYSASAITGATGVWRDCISVVEALPSGATTSDGFGGHTTTGSYDSVSAIDCVTVNGDISMRDCDALTVTRAHLKNGRLLCTADVTNVATDVWVDAPSPGSIATGLITLPRAGATATIDGLRVYSTGDLPGNMGAVFRRTSGSTGAATIINSVVALGSVTGSADIIHMDDGGDLTLTENLFQMGAGSVEMISTNETDADFNASYTGTSNAYDVGSNNVTYSDGSDTVTTFAAAETTSAVVADLAFTDAPNGDWTATGTGIPSGAGLDRPDVTYLTAPSTLAEAQIYLTEQ
jgi:hypothetical protein